MTRLYRHIGLLLLPVALLSCESRKLQEPSEGSLRSVHLALSVETHHGAGTKADVSIFTEMQDNPVFRGLSDIQIIPFADTVEVKHGDKASNRQMEAPGFTSLYSATSSYLYSSGIDAWIPTRTGAMLLYGRAPGTGDETTARRNFGSLVPVGFDKADPSIEVNSLGFAPDRMFQGTKGQKPVQAEEIRSVLNALMLGKYITYQVFYNNSSSTFVSVNWNESTGDAILQDLFLQMSNDGAVVSGSGPLVEDLLTSLYSVLSSYESHNSNVVEVEENGIVYEARESSNLESSPVRYKDLYNALRDELLSYIRGTKQGDGSYRRPADADGALLDTTIVVTEQGKIQFQEPEVRVYPENLGLPSGCAILRWTPTGFVIPEIGGVEGIAPMESYCFPPALYYFTNSTLRTSASDIPATGYESYEKWSDVLNDYELGNSVTVNTKSIALVKPLKFAVGMVSATVKAVNSRLQDNDGLVETTVEATGTNLPVTGIVLGRQYLQDFDFEPVYSEDGEYYLYDSEVPGVYLVKPDDDDDLVPIRTLSLQTPDEMDAYICLELRNDTGKTFYGADGRILPGRKFYLVGKLELPPVGSRTVNNVTFNSVVARGHITTVSCVIQSLAGAYNCVPELGKPQLVLGIQTKVNWTLSTPTTVMLE